MKKQIKKFNLFIKIKNIFISRSIMVKSRTHNSLRNMSLALVSQLLYSIIAFICRTVFIYTLGKNYLGLTGLFADILTLMSLAELGFGTAITYSMYKPMADGNKLKVRALLNLYRKIYWIIGIGITIVGLSLTPFLNFFISGLPSMPQLPIIYILYLLNTTFSYFFIYKKSILIATQNTYISSIVYIIVIVTQNLLQIFILIYFHSFIGYLIIQVIFTLLNNVSISLYVDQKYKYLKGYKHEKLDKESKNIIIQNVKAVFLSKLSSAIVTSTDNIFISKFVSTILLGYYSNYTIFINLIKGIFSQIFDALTGSVGNLVAVESPRKSKEVFENLFFINFWLIGFCTISLFILINPFIINWIGKSYLLEMPIVFMISVNLYMRLIRNTQLVYIDTYGLFKDIKWKCIAEAIINFVVSLIFVGPMKMGILGVLLGTFISNITTNFWFEPYIIFKRKFNVPVFSYFYKFFEYTIATLSCGILLYFICSFVSTRNIVINFIVSMAVCTIFINAFFTLIFIKTKEFRYFLQILNNAKQKITKKFNS